MSECVVRMEMPTENTVCELNYYSNSYYSIGYRGEWRCTITDKRCDHNKNGEFPLWCPIICQLPKEHGRLVDADAIEYLISENGCQDDVAYRYDINEMPTLVPAERSET